MRRPSRIALLTLAAGLLGGGFIAPTPAHAASDDFSVWAEEGCGVFPAAPARTDFVDHGEGVPSDPAQNDDYVEIVDQCKDGHGVRGYVWLNGVYLGSRYNGHGAGETVIWDPLGNLSTGDRVGLKVCLVEGPDGTGFRCSNLVSRTISEG